MNAKERRKLKREAEREASEQEVPKPEVPSAPPAQAVKENVPSPAKASLPTSAADEEALNAKARRMLKRAQERAAAESGGGGASAKTSPAPTKTQAGKDTGAADKAEAEGLNAKQRRMLKRARERTEEVQQAAANETRSLKRPRTGTAMVEPNPKHVPYVVFVGQLSYTTTAEGLKKHLQQGGVEGEVKVRLMTDKATGKSRGQAFVEVADAATLHKCLTLHHTRLDGRVVNVEKSCGGKKADKRKEKLQTLRTEQAEALRETRDRIVKEKVEAGELKEGELDEQAMGLLERYDGETVSAILATYCAEDRVKLRNPSAFFMCLAKKVIEGEIKPPSHESQEGNKGVDKRKEGNRREDKREYPKDGRKDRGGKGMGDRQKEAQEKEKMDVVPEAEEEEERGWTIGHAAPSVKGLSKVAPRGNDDEYDLGKVFRSVRGRGGGRMGGRGGRGRA